MNISHIMVIGAGVMGHGIALVGARSGFNISLVDVNDEILQKGMDKIRRFLDGSLTRGKITQEDRDSALSLIHPTTNLEQEAMEVDFLIEAIVENKEIKSKLQARQMI